MRTPNTPYNDKQFEEFNDKIIGERLYASLTNTVRLAVKLNDTRSMSIDHAGVSSGTYIKYTAIDPVTGDVETSDETDESPRSYKQMLLIPERDEFGTIRVTSISRLVAIRFIASSVFCKEVGEFPAIDDEEDFSNEFLVSDKFKRLLPADKVLYVGIVQSAGSAVLRFGISPDSGLGLFNLDPLEDVPTDQQILFDVTESTITPFIKSS